MFPFKESYLYWRLCKIYHLFNSVQWIPDGTKRPEFAVSLDIPRNQNQNCFALLAPFFHQGVSRKHLTSGHFF